MLVSNSLISGVCGTATTYASSAIWSAKIVRMSCQVTVSSGTFNGTFNFQASNDFAPGQISNPGLFQPTNWNTLGSITVVASVSSTAKSFLIMPNEACYEYLRIQFTDATGGTALGNFNARIKADIL